MLASTSADRTITETDIRDTGGPPAQLLAYLHAERAAGLLHAHADPARVTIILMATLRGILSTRDEPSIIGQQLGDFVDLLLRGIAPTP